MNFGFTVNGESNNEFLWSVKDLSNVDEDGISDGACQIRTSDFMGEMIDRRWTSSAGGEGLMFTL